VELLFAESSISGWGTEQHFAALATAMARRAHGVRCLMSPGSPLETALRAADVPVVLTRRQVRGSVDPRQMRLLHQLVSQRRPDWLITNDPRFYWPLLLIGRVTGTRTALFRHWEYMSKSVLSRQLIPRLADRFILVSQFQREHLRREGVDVSRMRILYNPIDTTRLSPSADTRAQVRASLGVTDSQVVVGYVGRMVREKGIFTLLTASEQLLSAAPESRLMWVGDGVDLAGLRERVGESALRERHIFRGWTGDMQGIYTALDVVVVPSRYPEPFGRVSVEAQACGTPVICSDAGGLPETLSPDVSGLLVRNGDSGQLAAAMLDLARNHDRRRSMALAGRQFACSNFSFERIAEDFTALLTDRRDTHRAPTAEVAR
jgi:glycosyltransferase involved in cell wall biosynthesis